MSLFADWLRSFWTATTMPLGRCVIRTAESVLFTCWPPAPEERYVSMRRSSSSISTAPASLEQRRDDHLREARVAAVRLVERALADEPVLAALGLEDPVGVLAAERERRRLDPVLLARARLDHLGLEAAVVGPAQVHPQEDLGPVLRVGAARVGLDRHDRVARRRSRRRRARPPGDARARAGAARARRRRRRRGPGRARAAPSRPRTRRSAARSARAACATRACSAETGGGVLLVVPEAGLSELGLELGEAGASAKPGQR